MNKEPLRFVLLGAGYWARPQLSAWQEIPEVCCVGIYNRTESKAEALSKEFGVDRFSGDAEKLIEEMKPDFLDIVTDVSTHASLVAIAAKHGIPVICQKPMARSLEESESMVNQCSAQGVPFFIHENWRWQNPIRALKEILDSGEIGIPFRAGIDMISGFPVFEQQPFLAEIEEFIIADLGSHTLDTARFLFGEAQDINCIAGRSNPNIKGEDHATIIMRMGSPEITVLVRMAYAENFLERECFPQTLFFIEGTLGSIEVCPNYIIRITTKTGTRIEIHRPKQFSWVDPRYAVVQSSIVACHRNLSQALLGNAPAETTGEDNLKTVRLVDSAYRSARQRTTIAF